MRPITIKYLAHAIKEREKGKKPIFFLGAGASRSGGIPLAGEIVKDILEKYPDQPLKDSDGTIKDLPVEKKTYTNLMDCLRPETRNNLLKGYIAEAKINVTHIYLAQLMIHNFADYVLTVNFDNLMLRALALFNVFPPIYDMAILKDLTTTAPPPKSVIYLHGQHHGIWLLNTEEEMAKVKETIPPMLHKITSGRPWVFIGYSGEDPIFEHIKNMGRFDNHLYWVGYKDEEPCSTVCRELFDKSNTDAYLIKGYDADSFMLRLNSELGLSQPQILENPFSSLSSALDGIVDIADEEPYKGVKQRLETAKTKVDEASQLFEKDEIEVQKKEIRALIIADDYQVDKINEIAVKARNLKDVELSNLLADLYFNWGTDLGNLADSKSGKEAESLYKQAFEKFQQAIAIKPDYHEAFYNWGNALGNLAEIKPELAESLYNQTFEKYQQAITIKPDFHEAFNNWGTGLGNLAQIKPKAAESLYNLAFEKYQQVIAIKPDDHEAFYNWGTCLGYLAKIKPEAVESLYNLTFEKYQQAIAIKPNYHEAFNNWGTGLGNLAQIKPELAESLYNLAFEKFQQAIAIKPDDHEAFYNWGNGLGKLAEIKPELAESLYNLAFEKFQQAIAIKPDDHEAFYNWGNGLGKLAEIKPEAAESLYKQAFEKYEQAIAIKPDYHEAFNNWGNYLLYLAKTKSGSEAESLYNQAKEKCKKCVDLGGKCYNLACTYALTADKENALFYLNQSLENGEYSTEFVQNDEDWKKYLEDKDFKEIVNRYRK
ncbi:SIR2 family protein [Thiotrichales bacterium HSG1]|nr:SIR2 family protein [Thiotrichales bacterium HSG1]